MKCVFKCMKEEMKEERERVVNEEGWKEAGSVS